MNVRMLLLALVFLTTSACSDATRPMQSESDLIAGESLAVAYSGFRLGQHPDRGNGAINPSDAEILKDLRILVEHDLTLIRLYDVGENSRRTLELIEAHDFPIRVVLGIWLRAEVSNHENCPWLDEPIPDSELAKNRVENTAEVATGIELAKRYPETIVAVNVGNEALVIWNDHMVPEDKVIAYAEAVKAEIEQPVTVADNYEWWAEDGAALAAVVDFIGVHTYPMWENRTIDEALAYTIENVERVRRALPGKPIAILEAGWATTASEFPVQASEANQKRYFEDLKRWAEKENVTVFFFEAFDEPWKGNPRNATGAEKHWGLFFVDRSPKLVMQGEAR